MALLVLKQVQEIMGTRDPMWFELLCQGYETTAATSAAYTLAVDTNPTAGMSFILALPSGPIQFTFVAGTPDTSGLQIEVGVDAAATLANILEALQSNWFVDQLFTMVIDTGVIEFTPRVAGSLILGFTNTTPAQLIFTADDEGSASEHPANYSALVQVWIEKVLNSGNYTALPPKQLWPHPETHRAPLDIASMFRNYVGYEWPVYAATTLQVLDALYRRYYLSYYEQLGEPPTPQRLATTPICRAWYAGTRRIERNDASDMWSLIRRTDVLNPFLTHRGRAGRQEVSPYQDHWCAWYRRVAKVDDSQIYLKATVHYTDATTATSVLWTDTNGSGYAQWRVGQWPIGFRRRNLHTLQPTKTPTHYKVCVYNAADQKLSEEKTYHLVPADTNEIWVEYVNSFGVVESVRTKGVWEHGIEPAHNEITRLLTVVNGAVPSEQESNAMHQLVGAQENLKVSTGFLDRGELNALIDVLLSPEWRWVDTARGTRHPLRLVGGEQVMRLQGDAEEHLYALNLEYMVCDPDMAWSDRLNWIDMPEEEEEEPDPEFPH